MKTIIPSAQLRWTLEDSTLDVAAVTASSASKDGRPGALGQERALRALELGLGIDGRGFNVFVVGASGTGRTSTVRTEVLEFARSRPTPDDVVLLYNFDDRDRPLSVAVSAGAGPSVKRAYDVLVEQFQRDLEKLFDSDVFAAKRQELEQQHHDETDQLLVGIEGAAREKGFILSRTNGTLTLGVADDEGNALSEEAFDALSVDEKQEFENRAETLQPGLEDALRKVRQLEKRTDDDMSKMTRAMADDVVRPLVDDAKQKISAYARISEHLTRVHDDILDRLPRLFPDDESEGGDEPHTHHRHRTRDDDDDADHAEPPLLRYRVNVLISHSPGAGAPVIQETHPTTSNLIGRIVHKNRGGETVTDHTHIKAGTLFLANGGYLLLHAHDLLRDPVAWEGLKRALKNREIELDDPGEPGRMLTVASLRPEPIPLQVKVCLIGTPDIYYALSRGDPDFQKLFKVKVDFDLEMDRTDKRIEGYLTFLVGLAHEEGLRPLAPSGAARLIEHAARIAHDSAKLTTRFGWIADLVREANFFAGADKKSAIERRHVVEALVSRREREGFLELKMREDVTSGRVRIETQGDVVGQVNGLTVIDLGSYQFGMPVRITCRVGAGKGNLIDVERETELGGPIHTKGTMILRGILLDRFAHRKPLRMNATVCMEQNYSDIDGDSASLAEACALISALADVPLRQATALTGSIDQRGQVQAVGGVNEKIEGYYRVVREADPSSSTKACVLIPSSNVRDLMLDEDVRDAVAAGHLEIVSVETLEDALEALSGRRAADVFRLAERRLETLALGQERGTSSESKQRVLAKPAARAAKRKQPSTSKR